MPKQENQRGRLVGKTFLTGDFNMAGTVLGEPQPGLYLIVWVNWMTGFDSFNQTLIPIEQMVKDGWRFYDCSEDAADDPAFRRHQYEQERKSEKPQPKTDLAQLLKKLDSEETIQ